MGTREQSACATGRPSQVQSAPTAILKQQKRDHHDYLPKNVLVGGGAAAAAQMLSVRQPGCVGVILHAKCERQRLLYSLPGGSNCKMKGLMAGVRYLTADPEVRGWRWRCGSRHVFSQAAGVYMGDIKDSTGQIHQIDLARVVYAQFR